MQQKTIQPLADVIVYDTDEDGLFAFHAITQDGLRAINALPNGIRTQESSLVVIHTGELDSVFDVLNEMGLVILTL